MNATCHGTASPPIVPNAQRWTMYFVIGCRTASDARNKRRTPITVVATSNSVPVVLNEILASNHSFTNANGLTSDWIELFNPSTITIDVTDLSLSNDPNTPRYFPLASNRKTFPAFESVT